MAQVFVAERWIDEAIEVGRAVKLYPESEYYTIHRTWYSG